MAKSQDGGLVVGQTARAVTQTSKLPVQGHIVQRILHERITQPFVDRFRPNPSLPRRVTRLAIMGSDHERLGPVLRTILKAQ